MKRSCIFLLVLQVLYSGLFASATSSVAKAEVDPCKKFRLSHTVIFSDLADFDGIRPSRGIYQHVQQPDHELGNDIIISLNSDLRRSRIAKAVAAFADVSHVIHIILHTSFLPKDATSPGSHSSYNFSSTDYHRYIFRLKPF
jgi:hypothetical protein